MKILQDFLQKNSFCRHFQASCRPALSILTDATAVASTDALGTLTVPALRDRQYMHKKTSKIDKKAQNILTKFNLYGKMFAQEFYIIMRVSSDFVYDGFMQKP